MFHLLVFSCLLALITNHHNAEGTTHSPKFLGLVEDEEAWKESNYGEGMIIGVIDTGVQTNHHSFSDAGMPKPPSKWKGKCQTGIVCNNKLIGAMSVGGYTPVDNSGHGSHTASIATGNFVSNAKLFGQANGKASGTAPRAHVAIYKACLKEGCPFGSMQNSILAAIHDGVDVISISLGGGSDPYYSDETAIGAFAAIKKGIFVSCAAGNGGPAERSLANDIPWVLTVGATTIDRHLRSTIVLGNNQELDGETINQPVKFPSRHFPLIYLGLLCEEGSFESREVKDKIVVCEAARMAGEEIQKLKGVTIRNAGGVGMILINHKTDGYTIQAIAYVLPISQVSYDDGTKILKYLSSNSNPTASLVFKGTVLGDKESPMVASFSSRGPSTQSPGILKPDITGPGVNILAAWNRRVDNPGDKNAAFNILSGTSMACPHLSGIAALIKSSHPDWSPAAIKSAIMTTADITGHDGRPIMDEHKHVATLIATGSGNVNPFKALDPGLIYDIKPFDYIPYLCGLKYKDYQVSKIVAEKVKCASVGSIREGDLNYPSFSVKLEFGETQVFSRMLTNVGESPSTYNYQVTMQDGCGVRIDVFPETLYFAFVNDKKSYRVSFKLSSRSPCGIAAIIWTNGKHTVRSPIYFQDIIYDT